MDEIKNCPMCGRKPDALQAHGFGHYSVECYGCGLKTQQHKGQEAAMSAWNRRADLAPAPMREVDGELNEELLAAVRVALNRHDMAMKEASDAGAPMAVLAFGAKERKIYTDAIANAEGKERYGVFESRCASCGTVLGLIAPANPEGFMKKPQLPLCSKCEAP